MGYPPDMRARILRACQSSTGHVDELCRLNVALGEQFADATLRLIAESGLRVDDVDLIGSHGQTVWHDVDASGQVTSTLQIGEASVIAERTGITTIHNFRPRDVAAGGQGAPLTGYADWLLLRHAAHWRAVQNIGGMGNVTLLPPLSDSESVPIAFDTGPGNALIDGAVNIVTDGMMPCDYNGRIARDGRVDSRWLEAMMSHPYFERQPPKTTGRELFGTDRAAQLVAEGQRRGLSDADIIATITALTAASIADALQRFAPQPVGEIIIGGGGVRNPALMEMLRDFLSPIEVKTHEYIGIDSDFKEALVFALLAHETWHARHGAHPSITGARHASILGQITPGKNYRNLIRRTWG
ncbi:MAG: anhydro-N-acetylmuramic acid kinase [Phototrophicales bacterium]|nr:MAG: anhydro-N-acetylmuramic acid kinase [Phototrophicales bacterium]